MCDDAVPKEVGDANGLTAEAPDAGEAGEAGDAGDASPAPRPRKIRHAHWSSWVALLVAAVPMAITLGAWHATRGELRGREQQRFDNLADRVARVIAEQTRAQELVLRGLRGLLLGSRDITQADLDAYVASLDLPSASPGIVGVGFVPVRPASAATTSSEARPAAVTVALDPRYAPVMRQIAAAGDADDPGVPAFRRAMARARTNASAVRSERLRLAAGKDEWGFLWVLPLVQDQQLIGHLFAPIRAQAMLEAILESDADGIDIHLYDDDPAAAAAAAAVTTATGSGSAKQRRPGGTALLANADARGDGPPARWSAFFASRTLDVGGRRLTVVLFSLPAFDAAADGRLPRTILVCGSIISALAGVIAFILLGNRRRMLTMARRLTEELARSEATLRTRLAAVDAAADMVVITDRAGRILYVNPAFTRTTGYAADEALGRHARILNSGQHPPEFFRDLWKTILAGKVWRGELVNRRKDGTLYPEEMSVTPVRGDDGAIARFVAIKRDVTRRKAVEAIEREHHAQRQAVKSMEHVLGVVGHELRTPLAGLRAIAELLLTDVGRATDEADAFLHSLHDEILHMSQIVDDLLEAARLNSGRSRWTWSADVDLGAVCRDAAAAVRPLVDAASVELTVEAPDGGGPRMSGDAEALRRLILNLLSNARKHTRAGSIAVRAAAVTDQASRRWVELEIADTGGGISPAIADRLGEAFALNAGVIGANAIEGAGLGLAICKGIAAAHGGSLRFESVLGRGTTVRVRLRADLPGPAEAADPARIEFDPVAVAVAAADPVTVGAPDPRPAPNPEEP